MKTVGLALGLALCANVLGNEPRIGDSVVVVSDEAEVRSKEGTLGVVSVGTQFSVKQTSGTWLLGLFEIEGQSRWGWMKASSVRALERDILRQPTYEFTWHNLLLARAKMDKSLNIEDHVDDYMKVTRYKVWQQHRNDEFQLQRKRIETLGILRQRLAEFDLERDFLLLANLTFDGYDFKTARFPIVEAAKTHYWYDSADVYTDSLPRTFTVFLSDPQLISGIPMEAATAERFLAKRKGRHGEVNREVYADIRIRITGMRNSGKLEADVRWARIFGDRGRTQLLYETPQSPVEFKPDSENVPPRAPPTVQASALPTAPSAARRHRVPEVQRPGAIALPGVPRRVPLAQPATMPTFLGNRSHLTQQPFRQGQS